MLLQKMITLDRQIVLKNPDAPYERYQYGYHVRSASDAMEQLTQKMWLLDADRFVLLADSGLPLHVVSQVKALLSSVAPCSLHQIAGTEQAKTLLTVATIGDEAIQAGATRASVVVALGGGLVGNIAGLLSSLLFRGATRLVLLPTTFLAMSNSCLSLKQGVNSAFGKNHYGQFKAPLFVWCDLAFLQTLPPGEIRAALCELIKNVLTICPERYDEIAALLRTDSSYSHAHLVRFLEFCLDAKCSVMGDDAHEAHLALLLEYGHTLGHAIELLAHVSHGTAVGLGLSLEAQIAYQLGLMSQRDVQAHEYLLQQVQVPPLPASLRSDEIVQILLRDNKRGYLPPLDRKSTWFC